MVRVCSLCFFAARTTSARTIPCMYGYIPLSRHKLPAKAGIVPGTEPTRRTSSGSFRATSAGDGRVLHDPFEKNPATATCLP